MASLRKIPGCRFWIACITLPDGKRTQRSTRETARKAAQSKADEWEKLSKDRAKARQAHKVIADIYRVAHKEELPDSTPRAFITSWLARRKGEIAPASYTSYKARATHFLGWLGAKADGPLVEIETRHIASYRDVLAEKRTAATANHGVKILRAIFEDARRDQYIPENPAKDCGLLKKTSSASRRPFTVDEIHRTLAAASDEWRSLVFFGIYTGQRLGDIAQLTWQNLDLQANEIHVVTAKTGRVVRIPIVAPLLAHIESLPAGDNPKAPLHPKASAAANRNNATLSRQFGELLTSIGLRAGSISHEAKKDGDGRAARRGVSELSFHSLRHTATSLRKNAGISPAIVQDIIGHESAEISAHYTHVDHNAKAKALASLPDFTQREE